MAWLFNTAGRRALNETAAVEALLSAPDAIYHRIPAAALRFGFRIRFQDILAAAKRKVKGVEQWVSFMPKPEKRPLWRVVCLTSRELMHHHADAFASLLQKDPGHYLELLMVSANSVVPHAAEELLQIIKDSHSSLSICSTADVHHMLEAAILRSHGTIIGDLAALPAAAGISSEQMCQLLRAALLLQDTEAAKKKSRVELYGDEAADVPKRCAGTCLRLKAMQRLQRSWRSTYCSWHCTPSLLKASRP
ncbi:hypothetical protein OEZ86_007558 [Tetradesmus obliquus]|nr:hypothetical protein OEZ86_007558 [Tetradesmus obliquus]